MAVAEICVVARPAIFVPFPLAAEDHQTSNAMSLVNREAALIVKDSDAKETLVQTAIDLAKDENRQALLHQKIRMLGIKDADETVAKEILKTIHG
jgi:UDP-N-acetylglucosamine--N-acetylmuramyl-(pentapeptide) pyrophosphoryl-undecaprenol N-acetylglucosamine transferase